MILNASADRRFSQRAVEVAKDLLSELDEQLREEGTDVLLLHFRLDGSDVVLSRSAVEMWIKESVDEGHPAVRYHIEERSSQRVLVNLAAFEDPDTQFYE